MKKKYAIERLKDVGILKITCQDGFCFETFASDADSEDKILKAEMRFRAQKYIKDNMDFIINEVATDFEEYGTDTKPFVNFDNAQDFYKERNAVVT